MMRRNSHCVWNVAMLSKNVSVSVHTVGSETNANVHSLRLLQVAENRKHSLNNETIIVLV